MRPCAGTTADDMRSTVGLAGRDSRDDYGAALSDLPDARFVEPGDHQVELVKHLRRSSCEGDGDSSGGAARGSCSRRSSWPTRSRAPGYWVQSFPEFKAERRGAPISAFLRWDETSPIHRRYKVRECDVLVVVSPSPPSPRGPGHRQAGRAGHPRTARRASRTPVPSTSRAFPASRDRPGQRRPLLGGSADGQRGRARRVHQAAPSGRARVPRAGDRRAHGRAGRGERRSPPERATSGARDSARLAGDTPVEPAPAGEATGASRVVFPISTTDSLLTTPARGRWIGPCSRTNATACALCALFCPEGAISRSDGSMAIDYLYCKGCGICEVVCPVRNAIEMEEVRSVSMALPQGRVVMTANEAAAYAVVLARVRAIGCYPITPQTLIVERARGARRGPGRRRVREPRERALDVRIRHRGGAGRRPHLHGDVLAGPAVRPRAAPPSIAGARAAGDRQRQPGRLRSVEHRARPLGQHEPARHRLDPALLLLGAGGPGQRPLCLPDRRDRDAAGDGLRRGLPALAHVGGRRRPGSGDGGRVHPRAAIRRTSGCSTRTGRARSRRCRSRTTTTRSSATSPRRWTRRGPSSTPSPRVHARTSGGRRSARSSSPATPSADTALVAIGTIGDTARELLEDDDDLLVVRVHAYRPFPAAELAAVLAGVSHVSVDRPRRRPSARSGPLGSDVRSLDLRARRPSRTSSAGSAAPRSLRPRCAGSLERDAVDRREPAPQPSTSRRGCS